MRWSGSARWTCEHDRRPRHRRTARVRNVGVLMAALLAACVAFQLNASMLSPALATIEKDLHTDSAAVGLSQTAFFTSAALFSLFLPRLGDIIGRKKVLAGMLIVMTVGCVVAALAPNIDVLFVGPQSSRASPARWCRCV